MKKIFIGMTGIALCLCLSACSTSGTGATVTNLSNQLDSTANTISNISTVSPTEIALESSCENEDLCENSLATQQSLRDEQYYRTEILDQTAKIKSELEGLTLSKAQKSAITDLTNTLSKYTSAVNNTKYEMNSSARAISSMKKNVSKNEDKLNAKYNRLTCNSNVRSAYYENLLNTLDEIENCLNTTETNTQNETQQDSSQSKARSSEEETDENENDASEETPSTDEDDQESTQTPQKPSRKKRGRFSRERNIDTYGPGRRNIDTFGGYGYGTYGGLNGMTPYGNNYANGYGNGYGYGNNFYAGSNNGNRMNAPMQGAPAMFANGEKTPSKRLETFEKPAPDGTVERVETPDESAADTSTENSNIDSATNAEDRVTTTSAAVPKKMTEQKNTVIEEEPRVVAHCN